MSIQTNSISIIDLIERLINSNCSFASYRFPNDQVISTVIQKDGNPKDTVFGPSDSGFVITPFSYNKHSKLIIRPDFLFKSDSIPDNIEEVITPQEEECCPNDTVSISTSIEDFTESVQTIKNRIEEGSLQKAVASRIYHVKIESKKKLVELFNSLKKSYPNAFVYIFNIPKLGCWIGATPEPIAIVEDNVFKTVSLAGTQIREKGVINTKPWGRKEIEEQGIVTNFLEVCLQKVGLTDYEMEGPSTQVAANLLHLKTEFQINLSKNSISPEVIINEIHPTPSVCGLPRNMAFKVIQSTEKHDREYYTGLIGPQNLDGRNELYVNLRCAKLCGKTLRLFAGAGITKDSDILTEWQETEHKLNTLLSKLPKNE